MLDIKTYLFNKVSTNREEAVLASERTSDGKKTKRIRFTRKPTNQEQLKLPQFNQISTTISKQNEMICDILGTYSSKLLQEVKKTASTVYHNNHTLNKDQMKMLGVPLLDFEETAKYKRKKKILGVADKTTKKLD